MAMEKPMIAIWDSTCQALCAPAKIKVRHLHARSLKRSPGRSAPRKRRLFRTRRSRLGVSALRSADKKPPPSVVVQTTSSASLRLCQRKQRMLCSFPTPLQLPSCSYRKEELARPSHRAIMPCLSTKLCQERLAVLHRNVCLR